MSFVIKSNFIGSFKLGDNICYNLKILAALYEMQAMGTPEQKLLLCKPIIIIIASICEAILYDFHMRIQTFTSEGVINLTKSVIDYIRNKKIDEFEKYISSAKKHDLFEATDTKLYEVLDGLRKLRNRVHIQNTKNSFKPDDKDAFNYERQVKAEKALEKILKTMAIKYTRTGRHVIGCVENFVMPWNEHYIMPKQ